LASNSPRRKELLGLGDWPFDIQAADVFRHL
jgi:predicted house-cleaning NTP pyrophosphatase (Maf/HAM1 superfamily)